YCAWIAKQGSWGSQPELEAFSEITQRPVIVVQSLGENPFEWSAGINLHFKGDPLIFRNHGATHYEAMVSKL
ncbi:MAG: OTU domain-containing protein, partial [Rhabdochlamydiaceae bacterium]